MIVVGITTSDTNFQNYPTWIKGEGVEVIDLSYQEENLVDILKCDAVVLTGGVDMHPRFYQNAREDYPFSTEFNEKRDDFEIHVFQICREMKIPILAICRGFQLVNVALGGDLIQDLQEIEKENHRKMAGVDGEHGIKVESDSLLFDIAKTSEGLVNSAHHQGIGKLASDLRISAWSNDGVAEAIEYNNWTTHPFFLGVQWHPERLKIETSKQAFSENIRQKFLEAAQKNKKS
ncbi:gamma-glutamyl-gamma-aminobutyrate hydrolase family protein [Aquirufa sp. ROCK-SH2]